MKNCRLGRKYAAHMWLSISVVGKENAFGVITHSGEFGEPLQAHVSPQVEMSAQADQNGVPLLLCETLQLHPVHKRSHDTSREISSSADRRHHSHPVTPAQRFWFLLNLKSV